MRVASKFLCPCGSYVFTNLFEGHGIARLLTDEVVDQVAPDAPAQRLIDLWWQAPALLVCKGCVRLYVWNAQTQGYDAYRRVLP